MAYKSAPELSEDELLANASQLFDLFFKSLRDNDWKGSFDSFPQALGVMWIWAKILEWNDDELSELLQCDIESAKSLKGDLEKNWDNTARFVVDSFGLLESSHVAKTLYARDIDKIKSLYASSDLIQRSRSMWTSEERKKLNIYTEYVAGNNNNLEMAQTALDIEYLLDEIVSCIRLRTKYVKEYRSDDESQMDEKIEKLFHSLKYYGIEAKSLAEARKQFESLYHTPAKKPDMSREDRAMQEARLIHRRDAEVKAASTEEERDAIRRAFRRQLEELRGR